MPRRLLVVDDDAAIRRTLVDALDDGAYEIRVADSAEEAIRTIDSGAPDLVLTDLRMKGLDGLALLRVLRERTPETRVVIMTAYHDVGTAVTAIREGAADFLCKPFDLATLRDVVSRVLGETTGPSGENGAAVRHTSGGSAEVPVQRAIVEPAAGRRGALVGHYRIEAEVGRGAMATVYRARDTKHDRPVAVKVLRKEVAVSIGTRRFLREIQIAARLHHPNILTLIDSGDWDGAPFFVMPLVDGPSLRGRLDAEGRLPVGDAAGILRDVAGALAAAHELGVVHRDVKPENVLLSGPHVWVADFGVARALDDASGARATSIGSAIGTPEYMAPEQCAGHGEVDHRADIYALGMVAYEVLSGRSAFSGTSARAILTAHLTSRPEPLGDLVQSLDPGLEETVMTCLAKEPDDRWPDARTLGARFAKHALGEAG